MAAEVDLLALTSLIISLFAASISLLRFKKESRIQRQADTVTTFYDIVKLIDNDRAVESRGVLRENAELNRIKDPDPDTDGEVPHVDNKTLEAARYVATTYDRLGFILKHDPMLEQEILDWNADVIADMWKMTRLLVKKKWRLRNPQYAREFERLAEKAIAHMEQMQQQK
jgi:hypothetical protein